LISAACPACGAPITYQHAASLSTLCGACDSTVVRDDVAVRSIGKLAPFVRELSPLQVGATGVFNKRPFRVAGGLRRVRPGVRWNEWYLVFDDGAVGWLGEGNGQLQIYPQPPKPMPLVRETPQPGDRLTLDGAAWTVSEVSVASLASGVGELPFVPVLGTPVRYADLRGPQGAVGTLDWSSGVATLYVGVGVDIAALRLEGLRPFAGWSDPVLVNFQGPELRPSRTLVCPACGSSLTLRAPADVARLRCSSCSSLLDVNEPGVADLVERAKSRPRAFSLTMGARATLMGLPWEIIGLVERYVTVEGDRYTWWEFLLHNPYRGYRWLVEDPDHHWSFVELLFSPPDRSNGEEAELDGVTFLAFNGGKATISYVLGELTWEAKAGDVVDTIDYIAPPLMLSRERSHDEITWSRGTYLSAPEVFAAFKAVGNGASPEGIAPHQPNPYKDPAVRRAAFGSVLGFGLLGVLLSVGHTVGGDGTVFTVHTGTMGSRDAPLLSDPFTLPDRFNSAVRVSVISPAPVTWSLIGTTTADIYESTDWGGTTTVIARPAAGEYVLRASRAEGEDPVSVSMLVSAAPAPFWPVVLVFGWAGLALAILHLGASSFEQRRWQNAGV
jgi:hypothetical protein